MIDVKYICPNKVILALMKVSSISENSFRTLLGTCASDEQQSVLKYAQRYDQIRSIMAIIQIKYCFKKYMHLDKDIIIQKDSYGRPHVKDWIGDISIAHSTDWILTGISTTGRIGVDIESTTPFPLLPRAEQLFLAKDELSFFQTIEAEKSADYLATIWTLKEAYLKEIGSGFTQIDPTSLSFNFKPGSQTDSFTYHGDNGLSTLTTYDVEGVAKAATSTSWTSNTTVHFYKHELKQILSGI